DSGHTPKGYKREAFEDAFERYRVSSIATPPQANNDGRFLTRQSTIVAADVAVQKSQKTNNNRRFGGVAGVRRRNTRGGAPPPGGGGPRSAGPLHTRHTPT